MRNLIYVLENGATVNTLEEAKASGKHFTMKCTPVKRPEIKLTEKQRAARVKIWKSKTATTFLKKSPKKMAIFFTHRAWQKIESVL